MANENQNLRKPDWIRSHWPCSQEINAVKKLLRHQQLATVCEEAACPNLGECFGCGTATFMIMGNICTRNCRFCNVTPGVPQKLNPEEPESLALTVQGLKLKYVVITSVTRDDLEDGGASHFTACIKAVRVKNPHVKIEILTPDFRHCMEHALEILAQQPADVFNHNIETVPRLYTNVRPQADYQTSLLLLNKHQERLPQVPTKSGLMLGLGETQEEILQVMQDLRTNNVARLTLGQYLQPTKLHLPVVRYVAPEEFVSLGKIARQMGFAHVASGPLVRSSYHADRVTTEEVK
jgi:lipoyl synthase